MLSNNDNKFFKKAKQIAGMSDFPKVHIGCIAVYNGRIIGVGWNTEKTHPIQKYYNRYRNADEKDNKGIYFKPKLHAEINCINSIKHMDIQFNKVKLYIYRKRSSNPTGMCRPCSSCLAAIKDMGIKNIYYTTDEGYVYEKLRYSA